MGFVRVLVRAAALTAALAVTGCAAAPKTYVVERQRTYGASFEQAWTAVIDLAASRNWPIKTLEKDSGIIAFEDLRTDSTQSDCGRGGMFARLVAQIARVNIFVRPSASGTTVTVNAAMQGQWAISGVNNQVTYQWSECASTGAVEAMVFRALEAELGSPRSP